MQITSTNHFIQTDNQTAPQEIGGSIKRISSISTGNEGVPTDRQTNQQTDRQTATTDTPSTLPNTPPEKFALYNSDRQTDASESDSTVDNRAKVSQVLSSLDSLKQDLHIQFKRLTPQEMLVFATIYQLTDQNISPDYSLLAVKTNLSESSIRDYVGKLVKKGIPVDKTKEDNKKVSLNIPTEFKRMASLQTLYELRNL